MDLSTGVCTTVYVGYYSFQLWARIQHFHFGSIVRHFFLGGERYKYVHAWSQHTLMRLSYSELLVPSSNDWQKKRGIKWIYVMFNGAVVLSDKGHSLSSVRLRCSAIMSCHPYGSVDLHFKCLPGCTVLKDCVLFWKKVNQYPIPVLICVTKHLLSLSHCGLLYLGLCRTCSQAYNFCCLSPNLCIAVVLFLKWSEYCMLLLNETMMPLQFVQIILKHLCFAVFSLLPDAVWTCWFISFASQQYVQ